MVVGCLYQPARGIETVRTPDDLVSELLDRGGWWWTWFGGRYDMLAVADVLYRRGHRVTCHTAGAPITRLVCGSLTIADAYSLIPMDLDRASGIAGKPPVGTLGWECNCGERCGGYCAITTGISGARLRELEDYCATDTRRVYEVIAALIDHCRDRDYQIRGTLGGTAWATAKARLGLPDASYRTSTWVRIRRASYGGRETVARARADQGAHYDIRSAYPSALADTPVPVGELVEVGHCVLIRMRTSCVCPPLDHVLTGAKGG